MTRLLAIPFTLMTMLLLAAPTAAPQHKPALERSEGCTTSPMLPISHAPALTCNRPAADMPPAPDGCPDYAPIAPPGDPIPPPCITTAQAEQWDEGGTIVTELRIRVDHPELSLEARTYTKLARYQFRNSQSETCSGSGIRNSEWELVDADWEASCGKDEGPLVWALFEVLNAGRWDALSIYTSPLPEEYMAVLTELAGLRNFTYLPYLEVQP